MRGWGALEALSCAFSRCGCSYKGGEVGGCAEGRGGCAEGRGGERLGSPFGLEGGILEPDMCLDDVGVHTRQGLEWALALSWA